MSDRAELHLANLKDLWRPTDRRSVDEWAGANVVMGAWSPWPGPFDAATTPWIREPLQVLGAPGPKRMTILGPAAGGKSTVGEIFMTWAIDNAPGLMVWFSHTEDMAKEFAETRLHRVMESCEKVVRWFPKNRHSRRTQAVHFPHMSFLIQAANETNAQSKHIRHMICDETWQYAPGMLAQLHSRTRRFNHNRTILELSTGSIEGDETDQAWHLGTKQRWQFRCTKCNGLHVPKFRNERLDMPGGVKWAIEAKKPDGTWDLRAVSESVRYECPLCQARFIPDAANKYALNAGGAYTEPAADAVPDHLSFHWNAVASDFDQLAQMAVSYIQAKQAIKRGYTQLMQDHIQKREAWSWSHKPPAAELKYLPSDYKMGDPWTDESRRFMTVDMQAREFWAVIRAWAPDGRSRLVWAGRLLSWGDVRATQKKHGIPDVQVLVDSGYSATAVYRECCRYGWIAIKGEKAPKGFSTDEGDGQQVRQVFAIGTRGDPGIGTVNQGQQSCPLLLVSDEMTSDMLDLFRGGLADGWTVAADTPEDHRQQMAARIKREARNPRTGVTSWEWTTLGKHGEHLWDCERYQLVAAVASGFLSSSQSNAASAPVPA